jgi:hypothetical protein
MQSLNVITNILSQDTDLQTKDNLEQSYNHDEKASFSHLVNQHIAEEKRTSANKEQPKRENTHPEVSRKTLAASEHDEQQELNQQDTDQVISKSEISKQVDHQNVGENISENSKLSALDIATADNDTSQEKEVEIQHSPEQFMNLLYSSDKTLTSSTLASNVSITQADTNTNKHLSDFDVASVNPLKIKSLETEPTESELTNHVTKTTTKLGEANIHNLVKEKNSSSTIDKAVQKSLEDSIGKKIKSACYTGFFGGY